MSVLWDKNKEHKNTNFAVPSAGMCGKADANTAAPYNVYHNDLPARHFAVDQAKSVPQRDMSKPFTVVDLGNNMCDVVTNYKYREDELVRELQKYIDDTYRGHYVGEDNVQSLDVIFSSGNGRGFTVGNVQKYASRYGKKGGYNRDDLVKTAHYALLALYVHDKEQGSTLSSPIIDAVQQQLLDAAIAASNTFTEGSNELASLKTMGEDEEVLESVPGRWVREVDEAIARDKEETKKLQSQSAVQETVRVLDTQGDKTWFGPPLSPRHAAVGGTELLKLRGTTRMSDDGTPRIGEDDDPTWVRPPEVEAGKIVVQVDGKRVCELYGTRDLNDFEIKRRAMCEVDVEKEIHGRPVKDMVYLPNRALNIVTGRPWMQADGAACCP